MQIDVCMVADWEVYNRKALFQLVRTSKHFFAIPGRMYRVKVEQPSQELIFGLHQFDKRKPGMEDVAPNIDLGKRLFSVF